MHCDSPWLGITLPRTYIAVVAARMGGAAVISAIGLRRETKR
jgi:hypothetical protein